MDGGLFYASARAVQVSICDGYLWFALAAPPTRNWERIVLEGGSHSAHRERYWQGRNHVETVDRGGVP
ncbi:hypothetical protein NJ7G_0676 [Natrinema sp. J7-2]|nr:hypothetical protein NJ7G_0676 [Natrinema sp. J7-2]